MSKLRAAKFALAFSVAAFATYVGDFKVAGAATLTISGDILIGATDVDLGLLGFYNVTFAGGTCAFNFSGCDSQSDFAFNTLANAIVAAQALLDQVLIDNHPLTSPTRLFDTDPKEHWGAVIQLPVKS